MSTTHLNREQGRRHKPSYSQHYVDRVVFVSGAASGIGMALARSLHECGARLVLADIDEAGLRDLVVELGADEDRIMTHVLDVRDRTAFDECFRRVGEVWGKLDLAFNNAGIGIFGDALEFTADDWDKLVDVNIKGVINGTISAISSMKRQGFGKIVNMASISGLVPFPGMSGYSATKHAVVGFTKSMAVECEDLGIRFCTVCPGIIRTPLVGGGKQGAIRGDDKEEHLRRAERAGQMDVSEFVELTLRAIARGRSLVIAPRRFRVLAFLVRGLGDRIGQWLVRKLYRRAYNR